MLFSFILFVNLLSQESQIKTVDFVDLERYSGKWYEISKIPNFFQDHCEKNATANYEIKDNGDILVKNECVDFQNEFDSAEGEARIVDVKTNSKLEVSFVSILGWNIFWGDYWIIELDEEYQFAAIATPSKKYGWVLSRTKNMNEEDLEKCYRAFTKNGYNIDKFEMSPQD
jgi:apolipoprotein D and lipocalin family protein